MSYEFKKLSEVEALTEVPEGAKVLAESNGQIVRVPGSGLGGGTGGGVQPDWNQNDSSAPDYIKNRPFYENVQLMTFLEEQQIDFSSSFNIPEPIVSGETYVVHWDNAEYTIEAISKDIFGDGSIMIPYLKQADGLFEISGTTMTAADKGIHNVTIYTAEIYRKTIDEKLIPDSIARTKSIIKTVGDAYPDENGNVAVSYASLTDRPELYVGSGSGSICQGQYITAKGIYSHAEGHWTQANGDYSHAEGHWTQAKGKYSHAEGDETIANGMDSHAEGNNTKANGEYSHAEGLDTIASYSCQHTEGKYNIEDSSGTYAHIVGNGSSESERSNAHTLDWQGNAWFAGMVEATAIILKSSSENSSKHFKITVDDSGTLSATEVTI